MLTRSIEERLQSGESLDTPDESGMTALHWASLYGHSEVVEQLINNNCNIDCLNSGLNTPLMLAVYGGSPGVYYHLIDSGADLSVRNMKDHDCLCMAAIYGSRNPDLDRLFKRLRVKGVDVNATDSTGSAPLHYCAMVGITRPIYLLVAEGADINKKHDRNGLTPLQMACATRQLDAETIRALLDNGAYANYKNSLQHSTTDSLIHGYKEKVSVAISLIHQIILDILNIISIT